MPRPRRIAILVPLALALACTRPAPAPGRIPLPPLDWRIDGELALPGPLEQGPRRSDSRLCLGSASGPISVTLDPPAFEVEASCAAPPQPPAAERWSLSAEGDYRARIDERGRVELQRACSRCRKGWKTRWKLRLPATAEMPPVVGAERVFVGTLDNRVYALRRSNGHRDWQADVEARVRRPLALVDGSLLVVPGNGERLLMLAAPDGSQRYSWSAPAATTIVGAPALLPDGRLAVALQGYAAESARLALFAPVSPGEDSAPADAL